MRKFKDIYVEGGGDKPWWLCQPDNRSGQHSKSPPTCIFAQKSTLFLLRIHCSYPLNWTWIGQRTKEELKEGKAENRDERIWFKKKIPLIQFNVHDKKVCVIRHFNAKKVKKYSNVYFFLKSGVRVASVTSRVIFTRRKVRKCLFPFSHICCCFHQ